MINWELWLAATLLLLTPPVVAGAPSAKDLAFFEQRIRPALIQHCYECHSGKTEKQRRGGLDLSTRAAVLKGGDSGPAVVLGKPESSLLIQALRYQSLEMPPKGKLPARLIEDFSRWIKIGAPDPRANTKAGSTGPQKRPASELWSFQPLKRVEPPSVAGATDAIDRFIRSRLHKEGFVPAGPASSRVLLRRLYLDLTGLPPTSKEIDAFEKDLTVHGLPPNVAERRQAIASAVDRLLAAPEFGERWARHWLDLTGYADTMGVGRSIPALEAWRYRDYVIEAFNADKPFDQFIRQQLAGDIQTPAAPGIPRGPEPTAESITATGFLAIGPWELVGGDKVQLRMDVVDRQVNRVGKAVLAMTFECARCHDHKFDPVSQNDYYAMAGLFRSTVTLNGRINGVFSSINKSELPETGQALERRLQRVRAFEKELASETTNRDAANRKAAQLAEKIAELTKQDPTSSPKTKTLTAKLKKQRDAATSAARRHGSRIAVLAFVKQHRTRSQALAVMDGPEPEDSHINIRGNAHQLGNLIPRGFPAQIAPKKHEALTRGGSGRVQFAGWLTDSKNPLTARVWVNRVWHHLFGAGLVRSVDNFGFTGETPSHAELLDYLALEFMQNGWSTKKLIRRIVLTNTWQQASVNPAVSSELASERDPENRLLWRANRRRLEAEAIRDSMLVASGQLDSTRGGPSLPVDVAGNLNPGSTGSVSDNIRLPDKMKFRRTIYLPQKRKGPFIALDFLGAFDLPDPNQETGRRNVTTVPTQALYLLNSPFVQQCAQALADRVIKQAPAEEERITGIFRQALGRPPTTAESADAATLIQQLEELNRNPSTKGAGSRAWSRLAQSLLISNEFLFRE